MTEADFRILLIAASFLAVRFGQNFADNSLPYDFRYNVRLNQSCDDHATPDDHLYPNDDDRTILLATEPDVVELLYRDGGCPQWIDINVEQVSDSFTVLCLLCCGRFTNDRSKMYYTDRGLGPFGVKSPVLPPGYEDGARFTIPHANA